MIENIFVDLFGVYTFIKITVIGGNSIKLTANHLVQSNDGFK